MEVTGICHQAAMHLQALLVVEGPLPIAAEVRPGHEAALAKEVRVAGKRAGSGRDPGAACAPFTEFHSLRAAVTPGLCKPGSLSDATGQSPANSFCACRINEK